MAKNENPIGHHKLFDGQRQSGRIGGKHSPYKRMTLKYGSMVYDFKINPSQYQFSQPQRLSTFKTQTTVVQEDFGKDIATITLSGNTGVKTDKNGMNGEQRFKALYAIINAYQSAADAGNANETDLILYNNTDVRHPRYSVSIPSQGFQYTRSNDLGPLYNYAITFVVKKQAGQPNPNNIAGRTGGNESYLGPGSPVINSTKASSKAAKKTGIKTKKGKKKKKK